MLTAMDYGTVSSGNVSPGLSENFSIAGLSFSNW